MDRKPFQHRTKAFLLIDGLLVGIMSGSLVVLYRYIWEKWMNGDICYMKGQILFNCFF